MERVKFFGGVTVKDKDGKLLTTEEQVKKWWKEHFSEVLNRPEPETPTVIEEAMDRELDIMLYYIMKE